MKVKAIKNKLMMVGGRIDQLKKIFIKYFKPCIVDLTQI